MTTIQDRIRTAVQMLQRSRLTIADVIPLLKDAVKAIDEAQQTADIEAKNGDDALKKHEASDDIKRIAVERLRVVIQQRDDARTLLQSLTDVKTLHDMRELQASIRTAVRSWNH